MKHYAQLTRDQRYQMQGLLQAKQTQTEISKQLNINKSTVCRELQRNSGQRGWRPKQAQEKSEHRRSVTNGVKFGVEDWNLVDACLLQDYSPEQVAGRLRLEKVLRISHETIYRHVYADKYEGGALWSHLRCQKKHRKRYASGQERRGMLKNRVSIDQRPDIVDSRMRVGDWEGDTVIGKNHKGALVTLAERKSRYLLSELLPGKDSVPVTNSVSALLNPFKDKLYTITFDNGKEFAGHEEMARRLNADIYFAHPYHSWERGLNENTNGLLRQYFPKGTDFRNITKEDVHKAVGHINHRPRKTLGYKSPHEVFFGRTMKYSQKLSAVALRT